ncbi:MAG TPA: hypothetical protein VF041_18895 [Gemmatimonadaceae bacterium]
MLPRQAIQRAGCGIVMFGLLAAAGCSGDKPAAPFEPATGSDAAELYWNLTLNYQSFTLSTVAPHDTIQLVATPRDAQGNPIQGLGPVTFTSDDTTTVTVSPTGLVRALRPASDLRVKAELTAGDIRHTAEVVVITVTDSNPPVLGHVSMQPVPPDSARVGLTGDGSFLFIRYGTLQAFKFKVLPPPTLTDTAGNVLPGILVMCHSSDSTIVQALCDNTILIIDPRLPGHAKLIATATAFGVTTSDTLDYTVTMPAYAVVWLKKVPGSLGTTTVGLDAPDITIGQGGTVVWGNLTGAPADIVFDDPSAVAEHGAISCAKAGVADPGGSGNIAAFGVAQTSTTTLSADNCRSRSFPAPGTYPYHSPLAGVSGRVVVTDGSGIP